LRDEDMVYQIASNAVADELAADGSPELLDLFNHRRVGGSFKSGFSEIYSQDADWGAALAKNRDGGTFPYEGGRRGNRGINGQADYLGGVG